MAGAPPFVPTWLVSLGHRLLGLFSKTFGEEYTWWAIPPGGVDVLLGGLVCWLAVCLVGWSVGWLFWLVGWCGVVWLAGVETTTLDRLLPWKHQPPLGCFLGTR